MKRIGIAIVLLSVLAATHASAQTKKANYLYGTERYFIPGFVPVYGQNGVTDFAFSGRYTLMLSTHPQKDVHDVWVTRVTLLDSTQAEADRFEFRGFGSAFEDKTQMEVREQGSITVTSRLASFGTANRKFDIARVTLGVRDSKLVLIDTEEIKDTVPPDRNTFVWRRHYGKFTVLYVERKAGELWHKAYTVNGDTLAQKTETERVSPDFSFYGFRMLVVQDTLYVIQRGASDGQLYRCVLTGNHTALPHALPDSLRGYLWRLTYNTVEQKIYAYAQHEIPRGYRYNSTRLTHLAAFNAQGFVRAQKLKRQPNHLWFVRDQLYCTFEVDEGPPSKDQEPPLMLYKAPLQQGLKELGW